MSFGKSDWVAMFREIGLDEPTMQRWHATFERRDADAHKSFLEWLGEPAESIERIRNASRNDWSG